jgi:hypothetical protein
VTSSKAPSARRGRRFGSCGDETLDKIEKERLAGGMDAALAEQSLRQLAPGA